MSTSTTDEDLITVAEAMRRLSYSYSRIRGLIAAGTLQKYTRSGCPTVRLSARQVDSLFQPTPKGN